MTNCSTGSRWSRPRYQPRSIGRTRTEGNFLRRHFIFSQAACSRVRRRNEFFQRSFEAARSVPAREGARCKTARLRSQLMKCIKPISFEPATVREHALSEDARAKGAGSRRRGIPRARNNNWVILEFLPAVHNRREVHVNLSIGFLFVTRDQRNTRGASSLEAATLAGYSLAVQRYVISANNKLSFETTREERESLRMQVHAVPGVY